MPTNGFNRIIRVAIVGLILSSGLTACGYYHEVTPATETGAFSGKETLGYEVIAGIMARNRCLECHSAAKGNMAGLNLESYATVKAAASRVAARMESGSMPMGGPKASVTDIEIVKTWVAANTPETSEIPLPGSAPSTGPGTGGPAPGPGEPAPGPGTGPAPTLDFALVKAQIFVPHCVGCHGSFNSYATIASRLGEIQRAVDTNLMPKNGPALSADLKRLLNEWITAGAPETADGSPGQVTPNPGTPGDGQQCEDEDHGQDDDHDEDPRRRRRRGGHHCDGQDLTLIN